MVTGGSTPTDTVNLDDTEIGVNGRLAVDGIDVLENSGDSTVPTSADQVPGTADQAPPGALLDKELIKEQAMPSITKELALFALNASDAQDSSSSCTYSCERHPPQVLSYEQEKYTCAPSSSRLVLWQWTGTDPTEARLAKDESTDSHGTNISDVPPAMNKRRPSYARDHFAVDWLRGPSEYMSDVEVDVDLFGHSLVNNLISNPLPWFRGHKKTLYHYDVAYGYSEYGGGSIDVAEEWDPSRHYTNWKQIYPNGNPYGYHTATLRQMWAAIDGNKDAVVW